MPATIIMLPESETTTSSSTMTPSSVFLCNCIRTNRPEYDKYHSLWHIASGLGPLLSIWYLEQSITMGQITSFTAYYVIPSVAVIIGIIVNIIGNIYGVFPVD